MGDAAVAVAKAIGYENAGTVEFILDQDGGFYFLEVNTRLQVEHPVTELVCGIDLVREQIRVARGEPLGYDQADITQSGAALECRLYAEDPAAGFLPATGTLIDFHVPALPGVRLDSGVETGSVVGVDYDPMLAKVVTYGADRREAIDRMVRALESSSVQGVTTNLAFLVAVLSHPAYRAGDLSTHFLEEHQVDSAAPEEASRLASMAVAVAGFADRLAERSRLRSVRPGYRNNYYAPQRLEFEGMAAVTYRILSASRLELAVGAEAAEPVRLVRREGAVLVWEDGKGVRRSARVLRDGARWYVHQDGVSTQVVELPRYPEPAVKAVEGGCVAPMPGKVVQVLVEEGASVRGGQVLVILEAMKMEHPVTAPEDGVVARVCVDEGDQVEMDAVLVVLE
jgi:acetyl/propionyl-CoA carboxylase alpha subunit